MQSLCSGWEFIPSWFEGFETGDGQGAPVCLPHTVQECPQHYTDNQACQMVCGYRRKLHLGEALQDKRIFLQFDGAAHIATVYLNGREVAHHRCGYTGFRAEITEVAILGGENILAVKLDTRETADVPPH